MEEKYLKDYTVKEFFEFLNSKEKEINVLINTLKSKKNVYDICCYSKDIYNPNNNTYENYFYCSKDKIKNALKTKGGKKQIMEILKLVFGYKFFDFTDEEIKKLESQGMFTKNKLPELFGECLGMKDGYIINIPSNWDEFADVISKVIEARDDNSLSVEEKRKYNDMILAIENLIAGNYKEIMNALYAENELKHNLSDVLKSYKSKKIIDVHLKNPYFVELLNHGMMDEKQDESGNTYYEECAFGDLTVRFIDLYNDEIKKVKKEKLLKERVKRYYKDIMKTPFDDLKNEQFPAYSDPDVRYLYNGLMNEFSKKKDDKSITLNAITGITYAGYFKSDYYVDSENINSKEDVIK